MPHSRSRFDAEQIPPSTYRLPAIFTGWYQPGMAQEAATASAARVSGAPARPKATRLPLP